MSPRDRDTSRIVQAVADALRADLVSAGELRQIIDRSWPSSASGEDVIRVVLEALLSHGIEVGDATRSGEGYVKFTAWRGDSVTRSERALRQARACAERDRDWAYWLCLRHHVDEYEPG